MEISVAVTISYADYKAETTPKFRSLLGSEYSIAAMQAMFEVELWAKARKKPWVAWVFEDGHTNSNHLKQLLGKLVSARPKPFRIYSHSWLTKNEPALHAPDLIAFEVAGSYRKEPTPIRERLAPKIVHHHMTRAEIATVVAATFKYNRER